MMSGEGAKRKRISPFEGKKHSPEARRKMSESAKVRGGNHRKPHTIEARKKMSDAHRGVKKGPQSAEHREKLSISQCGEKNHNWQGGLSFEPYCYKFNEDLKRRVRDFFDNQCVTCSKSKEDNNNRNLNVHHVEYNKNACCDGKPVVFAALCSRCHSRMNFDRERWENMLHIIIYEIYGGRSYFTREEYQVFKD